MSSMTARRRPRETAANNKNNSSSVVDDESSSSVSSIFNLSTPLVVNALIVAFTTEHEAPDWIMLSAKIYSLLKVFYSPDSLRIQFSEFLRTCEQEARKNGDPSSSLETNEAAGNNNPEIFNNSITGVEQQQQHLQSSSNHLCSGRRFAEEKLRDLIELLTKEKANVNSQILARVKKEEESQQQQQNNNSSVYSSSATSLGLSQNNLQMMNPVNTSGATSLNVSLQSSLKSEPGMVSSSSPSFNNNSNNNQTVMMDNSKNTINTPGTSSKLKSEQSSSTTTNIKQEFIQGNDDDEGHENNKNVSSSFTSTRKLNNLAKIWDTPQSQQFLLELVQIAQNHPQSYIFNLNVDGKVRVFLHEHPIGKMYKDVVAAPTSLQVIQDRIKKSFLSTSSDENSTMMATAGGQKLNLSNGQLLPAVTANSTLHRQHQGRSSAAANSNITMTTSISTQQQQQIRTVSQLYQEFSKMIANCVMFNIPNGYYSLHARNFMIDVMRGWSDHLTVRSGNGSGVSGGGNVGGVSGVHQQNNQ